MKYITLGIFAVLLSACIIETDSPEPYDPPPRPEYSELEVINHSGDTIYELYISPCEAYDWGTDWLYGAIYSGNSVVVEVPRGCWDAKAVGWSYYWEEYSIVFYGGEHKEWHLY